MEGISFEERRPQAGGCERHGRIAINSSLIEYMKSQRPETWNGAEARPGESQPDNEPGARRAPNQSPLFGVASTIASYKLLEENAIVFPA
jgi:hypothetical protein